MKRRALAAVFVLAALTAAFAKDDARQQILAVISQQEAAWNRGDLEGFMAGYWKSPALTFFSGGRVSHGWQEALDHYKARYQGEGREMGKLEFSELTVHRMGRDAAYVTGHFRLTMSKGNNPQGAFTLIFRKVPGGWKIVHDHTSAE